MMREDLLDFVACEGVWALVWPEGTDDRVPPAPEQKRKWLTLFLRIWSLEAIQVLDYSESLRTRIGGSKGSTGDLEVSVGLLLEALENATDAMLALKKSGQAFDIPSVLPAASDSVLLLAEELKLRTEKHSINQIARRLSAAIRPDGAPPQLVRVDEQGRVFDATGKRLFGVEPAKILEGKDEVKNGLVRPLAELRDVEG